MHLNTRQMSPSYWLFALGGFFIATVLAFEIMPLPHDAPPIEQIEFQQGHDSIRNVILPDNWRTPPLRNDTQPGVYRLLLPEPVDEEIAIFIPNFSGKLSVSVGGLDLSPGGILSGDLVPDQSIPYFAIIPTMVVETGAEVELTLKPGGKLVGFLGPVYIAHEAALHASYGWHHFRAVQLPTLVLFWQILLAILLLVLWVSRRQEAAALYGALILLFSSVHSLPIYLPKALGLATFATELGLVLNFWQSVVGLFFTYALSDRALPVRRRWLLLLPTIATAAYYVLPSQSFQLLDLFLIVPISLILVVWIVIALVRGALVEGRRDVLLILLAILASLISTAHDVLVLSNALPESNFLHFRVVFILILPAMSVIFIRRLVVSLNRVDDLVQTLEDRVRAAEADLHIS